MTPLDVGVFFAFLKGDFIRSGILCDDFAVYHDICFHAVFFRLCFLYGVRAENGRRRGRRELLVGVGSA